MNASIILAYISAGCALLVALVCLWRARRSLGDWVLAVGLLAVAAERSMSALSLQAATFGRVEFWQHGRFLALSSYSGIWLLFSLTFARGNISALPRRWRFGIATAFLVPPILAVAGREHLFSVLPDDRIGWVLRLSWTGMAFQTLTLVFCILALTHLERIFRASVGTIRWRIKFILLAVGLLLIIVIYVCTQSLLYRAIAPDADTVNSLAALLASLIVIRYIWRLDSRRPDLYPSVSVLRGSVTVLFVGIYLIAVGVLATVVTWFGGDAAFPVKAFLLLASIVGLAAFLQSDRARLRVRHFVSLHFKRPVHDYRLVWRRFSAATSACVRQDELCAIAVKEAAEVFDALSVTLWLRNEDRNDFLLAASSSVAADRRIAPGDEAAIAGVIKHFESAPKPANIDSAHEPWAHTLQRWHPIEFPNGGTRICAPLVRQKALIGLLIVGDRVNGLPLGFQDLELLECVTGHITSSLLNITLSHQLVQAKELEAFQTMAAFFVHDLKNAASTLSLILRNLPLHFNNPAFREDALRSIAGAAAHINELIDRLGRLRHEIKLKRTDVDLNDVVARVVAELEKQRGATIGITTLRPLPAISCDRAQIGSVVMNLALNALEAGPRSGGIRISTSNGGNWVVVEVADDGCGMSDDFVRRALFRPFQTTKKTGLGIGMFQAKTIVEAHGGRIAVVSAPNQGTTFSIYLPTYGQHS